MLPVLACRLPTFPIFPCTARLSFPFFSFLLQSGVASGRRPGSPKAQEPLEEAETGAFFWFGKGKEESGTERERRGGGEAGGLHRENQ